MKYIVLVSIILLFSGCENNKPEFKSKQGTNKITVYFQDNIYTLDNSVVNKNYQDYTIEKFVKEMNHKYGKYWFISNYNNETFKLKYFIQKGIIMDIRFSTVENQSLHGFFNTKYGINLPDIDSNLTKIILS